MVADKNEARVALNKLLESYDKLDTKNPSSFFIKMPSGHVYEQLKVVCHAYLKNRNYKNAESIVTAAPILDDKTLEYYLMIMSGPFRTYSEYIELLQKDGKFYFELYNLKDWPAKALYNFCIATRFPLEFSPIYKDWQKRLENGCDPVLGLLLARLRNASQQQLNFNHIWWDNSSSWEAILKGEMQFLSANHAFSLSQVSFAENPMACTPCNGIWGLDKRLPFTGMTDEDIGELFDLPVKRKARVTRKRAPIAFDIPHEIAPPPQGMLNQHNIHEVIDEVLAVPDQAAAALQAHVAANPPPPPVAQPLHALDDHDEPWDDDWQLPNDGHLGVLDNDF